MNHSDILLEQKGEYGQNRATLRFRYTNGHGDRYFHLPSEESGAFHSIGLNMVASGVLLKNDIIAIGKKEIFIVHVCPKCGKIMLYNAIHQPRQSESWLCGICEGGVIVQGALVEPQKVD